MLIKTNEKNIFFIIFYKEEYILHICIRNTSTTLPNPKN